MHVCNGRGWGGCGRVWHWIRRSVSFQCAEGLLVCLEALLSDPDVTILRIKNYLDPSHDARHNGGFRFGDLSLAHCVHTPVLA